SAVALALVQAHGAGVAVGYDEARCGETALACVTFGEVEQARAEAAASELRISGDDVDVPRAPREVFQLEQRHEHARRLRVIDRFWFARQLVADEARGHLAAGF